MNAKEEILKMLNGRLKYHEYHENNLLAKETEALIAATEAAIFDVPSGKEMTLNCKQYKSLKDENYNLNPQNTISYTFGFGDGCNFILNYKKPESDEK